MTLLSINAPALEPMSEPMSEPIGETLPQALSPLLMIWTSPAFPAGAFAFSHGLETLAEDGRLRDRATLEALLFDLLTHGTLRNDFILMREAWTAARTHTAARFDEVAALALALHPSSERYLESVTQGRSFFEAIAEAWPHDGLGLHSRGREIAYPIAFALAGAAHALPVASVLYAHGLGVLSNLVSAAIRLSVIGQTDGQRVIATALPGLNAAVDRSALHSLEDLGGALFAVDLASLKHETQYSRLFRS